VRFVFPPRMTDDKLDLWVQQNGDAMPGVRSAHVGHAGSAGSPAPGSSPRSYPGSSPFTRAQWWAARAACHAGVVTGILVFSLTVLAATANAQTRETKSHTRDAKSHTRDVWVRAAIGPEGVALDLPPQEFTARDVTTAVTQARRSGAALDFTGQNLRHLDLAGLDFSGAAMAGIDLFGADLTAANLSGADLTGGNLNRANLIRANLSGAILLNATLMRPDVSTTLEYAPQEMPKFKGADMRGIRMTTKLIGADFRGANLYGAKLGPHEPRADLSSMPASILKSCDFSGADLRNVDLSRAVLTFSSFVGAEMDGIDLNLADLSRADLSGADLTGADLTNANLDEANLAGVKGFDTVRGRDTIRNLDRVRW